jgi:cytoskeletal protein RodZ
MRRPILLLASGVLALAAAPPVFGAGDSPEPPEAQAATSTTSTSAPASTTTSAAAADPDSGGSASPDPADNCATPERTHAPAPAEGDSEVYPAGEAGEVEVVRSSPTDLEVGQVAAADGWTAETTEPSGPRVKVRFSDSANPSSKIRFTASMDQAGEEIHVKVTSCP